jgi:hypothetical protein
MSLEKKRLSKTTPSWPLANVKWVELMKGVGVPKISFFPPLPAFPVRLPVHSKLQTNKGHFTVNSFVQALEQLGTQMRDRRFEECRLLGCYAVWLLQERTFRKNLAPPSSG